MFEGFWSAGSSVVLTGVFVIVIAVMLFMVLKNYLNVSKIKSIPISTEFVKKFKLKDVVNNQKETDSGTKVFKEWSVTTRYKGVDKTYPLNFEKSNVLTLGRVRGDIIINDPYIAREVHICIGIDDKGIFVQTVNNKNPVYSNGSNIGKQISIENGTRLDFIGDENGATTIIFKQSTPKIGSETIVAKNTHTEKSEKPSYGVRI